MARPALDCNNATVRPDESLATDLPLTTTVPLSALPSTKIGMVGSGLNKLVGTVGSSFDGGLLFFACVGQGKERDIERDSMRRAGLGSDTKSDMGSDVRMDTIIDMRPDMRSGTWQRHVLLQRLRDSFPEQH